MRDRWISLYDSLGIPTDDGDVIFTCIEALHVHPPRAYHNLHHVESMLADLDTVRDRAESPDIVALAIWFHDCIYLPLRSDNEARSADTADLLLRNWLDASARETLRSLILATRHQGPGQTPDECLLADLDLAILAAEPAAYDDYVRAIRQEYADVEDAAFAKGRANILNAFLARESIYQTPEIRRNRQGAARANLRRELDALSL